MTRRGPTAAFESTRGGRAYARAALAGNPSDGFGGATLAVTVPDYRAEVEVSPADCDVVEPDSPLVAAALRRFVRETGNGVARHLRWRTSIPREVGLGGSSAIVIAALRALCAMHELDIAPGVLAELALAVEVEELGIHAGPQDRFAQAHEGLTFMDFAGDRPAVERLDPALLPPLVLAYSHAAASPSGVIHGDLRERFERGDRRTRSSLAALAGHARDARDALVEGAADGFARAVDGTFDERRRLIALDSRQAALVEIARRAGAAANYAGSGGAVVAVCRDGDHCARLVGEFERSGCTARRMVFACGA